MNRWNPTALQSNIFPIWAEKLANAVLIYFFNVFIKYVFSYHTFWIRNWLIFELTLTFTCFLINLYCCCHLFQIELTIIRVSKIGCRIKIREFKGYGNIILWYVLRRHVIIATLNNRIFFNLCPWAAYQCLSVYYKNRDNEQNDY